MDDGLARFKRKQTRDEAITVRFGKAEYAAIVEAAEREGLTKADWFRKYALDAAQHKRERISIRLMHEDIVFIKDALTSTVENFVAGRKMTLANTQQTFRELSVEKVAHVDDAIRGALERSRQS
jgi:uncharacterized protein (DUF1778 family)